MIVSQLVLEDFRNYRYQAFHFAPGVNLLLGGNAQGKTNAIEALYLLATGASHRTARDIDLVREGASRLCIRALITDDTAVREVESSYSPAGGKRLTVGRRTYRRLGGIQTGLQVVLFAPEDLELVKGAPSRRRYFLDEEVFQASPAYRKVLAHYNRCLAHRNRLLKEYSGRRAPAGAIETWDRQLVEPGCALVSMRHAVLSQLAPVVARVQQQLTGGRESLVISYQPSVPPDQRLFLAELERRRAEERARGVTLTGPHRDDFTMNIGGMELRARGSQGQQRCAVMALKVAVMTHLENTTGQSPVLLLDDILSELDPHRQQELLHMLSEDSQTVITSADQTLPGDLLRQAPGTVFQICSGSARKVG